MVKQFHILSFEGPDPYARAGGIASRISGLANGLAEAGFETHVWFVGDPNSPGHEPRGSLTLHRWCQWISQHHAGGVYDGEEGKRLDFASSLPPFLFREVLLPGLEGGDDTAVVLAEEWHTADAVLHLDWLLRTAGLRDRVTILWNANNVFGFDRIDWAGLAQAAVITTVSRYMRHRMWSLGVDPVVIPNGLSADALQLPDRRALAAVRQQLAGRTVLTKVARWDPDKRWLLAVDTVGELKSHGWRPLLIARGGVESHGNEVLRRAAAGGLRVSERVLTRPGTDRLVEALRNLENVDVLNLRSPISAEASRVLFRGSDAVLANSGHEPFGLVGLEAMAAGGLTCTGSTGEDYVVPSWNALVLQSNDPREFISLYRSVRANPAEERAIRRRARETARKYLWNEIIQRNMLPQLALGSSGIRLDPAVAERRPILRAITSNRDTTSADDHPESAAALIAFPQSSDPSPSRAHA